MITKATGIEIVWKRELSLCWDNKTAIIIALNTVQHDRIKHVEIDRRFIKELVMNCILSLVHVSAEKQLDNLFTKGFNKQTFHTLVCKLGMCDIFAPT